MKLILAGTGLSLLSLALVFNLKFFNITSKIVVILLLSLVFIGIVLQIFGMFRLLRNYETDKLFLWFLKLRTDLKGAVLIIISSVLLGLDSLAGGLSTIDKFVDYGLLTIGSIMLVVGWRELKSANNKPTE